MRLIHLLWLMIFLVTIGGALAEVRPHDNINLQYYNLTNVTKVLWSDGTSQTTAASGSGSGGNGSFNQTLTDSLYLNKTDQRYNETTFCSALVSTVGNWSADSASYNTITQANAKYVQKSDSAGGDLNGNFSNLNLLTDVVGDVELNTTQVTLADFTNDAGFLTSATDQNNYTTSCSISGTSTKTVNCARNGAANFSFSFTDIDTDTDTDSGYTQWTASNGSVTSSITNNTRINLTGSTGIRINQVGTDFTFTNTGVVTETDAIALAAFVTENTTIVRAGSKTCSGQLLQNVTINSSGIFGSCVSAGSGESTSVGYGLSLTGVQINISAATCTGTAGTNLTVWNGTNFTCVGATVTVPYQSSAAGWTNTTTTTSTSLDVNVDSGTFFVNSTSNRVGIGTANPAYALDMGTSGQIKASVNGMVIDTNLGYAIGGFSQPASQVLQLGGQNLNAVQIFAGYTGSGIRINQSTGVLFVGVGENVNPAATFHVYSNNSAGSFLVNNATGTAHLFVNGNTGYVGIGDTSPSYPLEVNGIIAAAGSWHTESDGGTLTNYISLNNNVYLDDPAARIISIERDGYASIDATLRASGGRASTDADYTGANLIIAGGPSTGSGLGGNIIFRTSGTGEASTALNNVSTIMVINSSGKIGVGTSILTQKFNVNGSINVSAGSVFINATSCDSLDTLANGMIVCGSDASGVGGNGTFNQTLTDSLYYPRNTNPASFYNSTTLPATPYQSSAAGFTNTTTVTSTLLKLGVGTATPVQQLEVVGSFNVTQNVYVNNTLALQCNATCCRLLSPNGLSVMQSCN